MKANKKYNTVGQKLNANQDIKEKNMKYPEIKINFGSRFGSCKKEAD